MTGHALSVRQLRFRGRVANSLATRGRVEMALAAGASRLEGEAILCVRRIAIALPRVDNLSAALDAERSNAARPAHDAVPANANAILFADRAELLACLARDWCAGNASVCWWWPVLFPRDDFAKIVRAAWLEDARPVPAALARLEAAGLAPKFLATLSPGDVATLWRNIVHTFQLPALDAAWSATDITAADPATVREPRKTAPWASWIIPDPSLRTDCARILITAILLERAPAKVRSVSFASDVRAWIRSRAIPAVDASAATQIFPLVKKTPANGNFPQSRAVTAAFESTLDLGRPVEAVRTAPASPPNRESIAIAGSTKVESGLDPAPPPSPRTRERPANSVMSERRVRPARIERAAPVTSPLTPPDESIALPAGPLPNCISTEWGGSFYLVNVAIALGFYGDFTTPARPGLALPLWDFLALVGERMIGEEFAEDPLPCLFAKLSGRAEGESPGADFEAPTGETLAIWLDRICHEIQARVAASLGLGHDCDLGAFVLNHHAKIETNSERLDAHFSLAEHPVELRVAGLDRDPGWVPAGGRSIYFHYD